MSWCIVILILSLTMIVAASGVTIFTYTSDKKENKPQLCDIKLSSEEMKLVFQLKDLYESGKIGKWKASFILQSLMKDKSDDNDAGTTNYMKKKDINNFFQDQEKAYGTWVKNTDEKKRQGLYLSEIKPVETPPTVTD